MRGDAIQISPSNSDFFIVPGPPERPDAREAFVLKLADALHRYGTPAHRLEQTMDMITERLGLQGHFFALPTSIFAAFGRPESHRTSLIRAESGEVNLERLSLLDELADEIIRGTCSVDEGSRRIDEIAEKPNRFGHWATLLGTALSTGIAARVFGGGWREVVASTAIGGLIGILGPFFSREESRRRVFDITGAIIAASLAAAAAHQFAPFSVFVATLAGLIILVPGMRLTTAMTEIASGHLVSGSARLTGAAMAFLSITFGTALGNRITQEIAPAIQPGTTAALPLPDYTLWIALALYPLSSMILMKGRPSDIWLIALSTFLAFTGSRLGSASFGPELGAFIGALTLGLGANQMARLLHRPAALIITPGLLILVPGSLGYRSLTKLMEQDVVSGIEMAFSVAVVGIAIVTGLLLANALLPSRRSL